MPSDTDSRSGSVNTDIADFLEKQKEDILTEWRQRVRTDSSILPSKSLNQAALTNHLPQIFDALCATIRQYRSSLIAEQAVKDAREHGAIRWRQGYELSEVMRELKHLRSILIYHQRAFENLHQDNGMAAMLFVSTILHRFMDEIVIEATEEYVASLLSQKVKKGQKRIFDDEDGGD